MCIEVDVVRKIRFAWSERVTKAFPGSTSGQCLVPHSASRRQFLSKRQQVMDINARGTLCAARRLKVMVGSGRENHQPLPGADYGPQAMWPTAHAKGD
jgi:hypothetical protein